MKKLKDKTEGVYKEFSILENVVISTQDKSTGKIKRLYTKSPAITTARGMNLEISMMSYESDAKNLLHELLKKVRSKLSATKG